MQFPGYFVLSTVTVSGSGTVVAHVRIRHKANEGFELEKIQNTGVYNTLEGVVFQLLLVVNSFNYCCCCFRID
jgi:hypothetical protein